MTLREKKLKINRGRKKTKTKMKNDEEVGGGKGGKGKGKGSGRKPGVDDHDSGYEKPRLPALPWCDVQKRREGKKYFVSVDTRVGVGIARMMTIKLHACLLWCVCVCIFYAC